VSATDLVRRVLAAFESADVEPLLSVLDDNVVWKSAFQHDTGLRIRGEYHGRAGALEIISEIAMIAHFSRFHPKEILSDGVVVWCLVEAEAAPTHNLADKRTFDAALRCRVRNGRILEIQNFFDTASLRAHLVPAAAKAATRETSPDCDLAQTPELVQPPKLAQAAA